MSNSTTVPPETSPPSSSPSLPPSSSPPPPSSTPPSSTPPQSSSPPPPPTSTTSSAEPSTIVSTVSISNTNGGETSTLVTTITTTPGNTAPPASQTETSSSSSTGGAVGPTGSPAGGLNSGGRIAIAVVVPIAAVALLVLAGIFLWRKRKQRKEAEEQRRKEVEDYTYNPNADPTIPAVAGGGYEMKEDSSSGYRGWGSTTLAGSTGRKASTTMSGGAAGVAYSDATSPTRGGVSDSQSREVMMHDGAHSSEGEILGAMGPAAANNRGDVHRGPSNASSSYSGVARSDGSGDGVGVAYGDPGYYNQYGSNNPYSDAAYGSPQKPSELGEATAGAPVIRDNPARRNTRIENPAHYPQQSAGISQNF